MAQSGSLNGRLTANDQTTETRREGVRGGQPYFGFFVTGTFSGGTVQVEAGCRMEDGSMFWAPIPNTGLTAPGHLIFAASADALRIALRNAGASPDIQW